MDQATTHQTWFGWEAILSDGWGFRNTSRYAPLATMAADLGVNRIRLGVSGNKYEAVNPPQSGYCGGGSGQWTGQNDNSDPNVMNAAGFRWYCIDRLIEGFLLPLKAAVEAKGERFYLNVNYVGFHASAGFQQNTPAEYVEFMLATLRHLRDRYGLIADFWEVRLEPDTPTTLSIGQVAKLLAAAGPAARNNGFPQLKFIVPSVAHADKAVSYFNTVMGTAGAAPYVDELAYHRYGTEPSRSMLQNIWQAARGRGVRTAMLEFLNADEHDLYDDIAFANVSAWQKFGLASSAIGGPSLFFADTVAMTFSMRPDTYPLRQFMKYIRPGAVRLEASTPSPAIEPVAFRNANGKLVVVANVGQATKLRVTGLAAGTYDVTYTTASDRDGTSSPVTVTAGDALRTEIPAKGTITMSQR